MKCPKCGAELKNEAKFCGICGSAIDQTEQTVQQRTVQQSKKPLPIGKVAAVAAVIIVVIVILSSVFGSPKVSGVYVGEKDKDTIEFKKDGELVWNSDEMSLDGTYEITDGKVIAKIVFMIPMRFTFDIKNNGKTLNQLDSDGSVKDVYRRK
ncbi:hypothetical protein AGMMS49975_25540 [Clostridia bacterium]|nr:hypothetical protein AGMMS49975_25540 [Clostridia bacterium]